MNTHMIIELVGYFSSILVLISFLMTSVVKLRVINSVGGFIFAIYAMIIQSYPTALMNFCLVAINIYYLVRLKKTDKHYDLVESKVTDKGQGDSMLRYFLEHYKEDIQVFFPEFNPKQLQVDTAYLICCDANPAGVLLGKKQRDNSLEVYLDYSTPTYRDCSVGTYLYSRLPEKGIQSLTYSKASKKHEAYLQKMGFVREDGTYVKNLSD